MQQHLETWVAILAVTQGLVMVLTVVIQVGGWKARREDSTKSLAELLKSQGATIVRVESQVAQKREIADCEARSEEVDECLSTFQTKEHCATVHNQLVENYQRTSRTAHEAANAAQTVVTAVAVITKQLEGIGTSVADTSRRLGNIEAALIAKGVNLNGKV